MPVINYYEKKGKVHKIDANRPPDEVYGEVRQLFVSPKS